MIKKAQIKFIAIIMSILMGFFGLLSLISIYFLHKTNTRNIDNHLTDTILDFKKDENSIKIYNDIFIVRIDGKNSIHVISLDTQIFTEEQALTFSEDVITKPFSSGKEKNIFYKIVAIESSNYLFALDTSEYISQQKSSILKVFILFLVVYLILFIIVYLFSFSVFEPIKDAFVKQKQFISDASHELKTPIAIISANADVLQQTNPTQWTDNIKTQTERLEVLITDMLDMAKIDETKPIINKEEFNISEEVLKNVLHFDALAFEKGKTLESDIIPDLFFNGDKQGVNKVINILLDNAIKYSSEDGYIKVSLYKKNGKITLSVYNTGSSVPDNESDKIFQRFYRSDNSRSRDLGGSGLGLAIAKGIATANKWKISALSHLNESMTITIIF